MRIAYVSLHWPRTRHSGVGKKIEQQIKAWRSAGHEARLFMHTSRYQPESDLVPADLFPYETDGKLWIEFNRSRATARLMEAIQAYRPDLIYLRYGIYVYPVHKLAAIAPVVEEINTNDLTQHEGLGKTYSLYNRWTRGILLSRICGLITVSRELSMSSAFAVYHKPVCTIANGIELKDFDQINAPNNHIPRLIFIGNPGYLWHGVDKLSKLARLLPDVQFDIIGYDRLPGYEPVPPNLQLHGFLPAVDYHKILARADAAVSSLAMHRVGLNEASPLKSREYLAYGIPLISAYIDTDLDTLNLDFLLKIPNTEDNILTHTDTIRDFAYRVRGRRVDRKVIAPRINMGDKESKRIAFFEEMLSGRRTGTGS